MWIWTDSIFFVKIYNFYLFLQFFFFQSCDFAASNTHKHTSFIYIFVLNNKFTETNSRAVCHSQITSF